MIQSSQIMNSIGKQRCIHKHPIRRSLRNICYDASLYEQFADIFRGIVIPIYNESTGLTDIGFVNFVPFSNDKYKNNAFIKLSIPQFIPNINGGDFLREELKLIDFVKEKGKPHLKLNILEKLR